MKYIGPRYYIFLPVHFPRRPESTGGEIQQLKATMAYTDQGAVDWHRSALYAIAARTHAQQMRTTRVGAFFMFRSKRTHSSAGEGLLGGNTCTRSYINRYDTMSSHLESVAGVGGGASERGGKQEGVENLLATHACKLKTRTSVHTYMIIYFVHGTPAGFLGMTRGIQARPNLCLVGARIPGLCPRTGPLGVNTIREE